MNHTNQGAQGYGASSSPPNAGYPATSYNTGYTPIQFNDSNQFWGNLFDGNYNPSELFCRLVDSMFFAANLYADQYKNSGYIEPSKFMWITRIVSSDVKQTKVMEDNLQALYDTGSVPYRLVQGPHGPMPILDRQGYLHMCVFDARALPDVAITGWNKLIATFSLRDPLTNLPFPPIPRAAYPTFPSPSAKMVATQWLNMVSNKIVANEVHKVQAQQHRASLIHGLGNLVGGMLNNGTGGTGGLGGFL